MLSGPLGSTLSVNVCKAPTWPHLHVRPRHRRTRSQHNCTSDLYARGPCSLERAKRAEAALVSYMTWRVRSGLFRGF